MCRLKRVKQTIGLAMLAALMLLTMPSWAFATYAYNYGRTKDLAYADEGVYYAERAWYALGSSFTYNSYTGADHTESKIQSNMPNGNAFYSYTHGDAEIFLDNIVQADPRPRDSDPGVVTRSDVANWRAGDWKKLVFADWCNSSDNSYWARAFDIQYNDGSTHAYLGWEGTLLDNYDHSNWDNWFWWVVQNRYTISYSANYASYRVPSVQNWLIRGTGLWSY